MVVGICLGAGILYRFMPRPMVLENPVVTENREIKRAFDSQGKLVSEVVVERSIKPMPNPKPRYKITLIPSYSFLDGRFNYAGLYEKRYDLPIIGDCYLGLYASSKLELGVSISKEFY